MSLVRPYENLETSTRDLAIHFTKFTYENLQNGWEKKPYRIPSILPPIDWDAHSHSFSYHLHAWDAITDLLMGYDRLKDEAFFEASLAHARSWLQEFQIPVLGRDSNDELDSLVHPNMPVEWYDMAVGLRAYRIAYILDHLIDKQREKEDIELFTKGLLFHLSLLRREHFFRAHSNHGLYQALGHLAAARRFRNWTGMEDEYQLAKKRLETVISKHFSREGPHREHSPGYHYMILGTLINARRSGLLDGPNLERDVQAIEAAFVGMVKPDWGVAEHGDTDPRKMFRHEAYAKLFQNPELQFIISQGTLGISPSPLVNSYPDAGYAFARLYAPDVAKTFENASYLSLMAGFHSRVHKHADHLAFIWFDRNRDILIDPGRYAYAGRTENGSDLFKQGFWYSDPKRIYVESTRAHNCVEIDGQSYPRRVTRFGSALKYAGEQNGLAVIESFATHFRTVRHWRGLIMAPGRFLLVLDWLNDRTKSHDYRQWFKFQSDWEISSEAEFLRGVSPATENREVLSLMAAPLLPGSTFGSVFCGQQEPELAGWMSDAASSLIPAPAVAMEQLNSSMASFATLLTFGEVLEVDRQTSRANASLRNGKFYWRDERGPIALKFRRSPDQVLTVTLKG